MAVSNTEQNATIIEFAVRMESSTDEQLVRNTLQHVEGVINIDINLSDETVVVNSILSSFRVQQLLESTGNIIIFKSSIGIVLVSFYHTLFPLCPLHSMLARLDCL